MPKMKSHSGAAKRFKTTATGKIVRRRRNRNHLLEKKSSSRKRRLAMEGEVSAADSKRINKMLGR
ncbi:MAG TPA: 50S ribosomal protein L35 [Acidimicrobiaceae bacterium]|nr:50S ribosomal protein L35 [Acidimicrobiaceae bacterium]